MNRITPVSCVFYAAYAIMLLLPGILQTVGELRFCHIKNAVKEGETSESDGMFG